MYPEMLDAGLDAATAASRSEEQTEVYCRVVPSGASEELLWLYPHAMAGNGAVCSFFARLLD